MSLKRKYSAPKINVHSLDKEICLVMASDAPTDPTKDPDSEWSSAPSASESPAESSGLKRSDYPFGGDKPDYSNM
ncbi:MAG: hypothetical protein JEZ14_01305 [Marinilabiliaceae bacterium]|nr:hypothetical protein [Marinilabiliaceae bacterium]